MLGVRDSVTDGQWLVTQSVIDWVRLTQGATNHWGGSQGTDCQSSAEMQNCGWEEGFFHAERTPVKRGTRVNEGHAAAACTWREPTLDSTGWPGRGSTSTSLNLFDFYSSRTAVHAVIWASEICVFAKNYQLLWAIWATSRTLASSLITFDSPVGIFLCEELQGSSGPCFCD